MKIIFEKDTPEEKERKKAERKAKFKEKYGHLAHAQEGSIAKFIADKFKKNKGKRKKFFDDSKDFEFLKEADEGDSIKNIKDLKNKLFPKVDNTQQDDKEDKK